MNVQRPAEAVRGEMEKVGIALSAAANLAELATVAITEAQRLVPCDGVIVYRWDAGDPATDADDSLVYVAVDFASLGLSLGGRSGKTVPLDPVPIYTDHDGNAPRVEIPAVRAVIERKLVAIDDIGDEGFDLSDVAAFDDKSGYATKTILTLPLLNRRGFARGALQLVNYVGDDGEDGGFTQDAVERATVLATQAGIALDTLLVREQLIETGIALSAERNADRLLERILLEAKNITNADGGTLYLRTDNQSLRFAILRNDTLGTKLGGTSGNPITFPELPLMNPETGEPNHNNVATHVALSGETINIEDAYNAEGFDFSGTKKFDESTGYRSKSFLTMPLRNYEDEVIGVLQLINARDPDNGVIVFDDYVTPIVGALASQAAVALDNQQLIAAQKALFDSFVDAIADAIDAKSPYTGGHCNRVPEIAMMIAREAVNSNDGPFQDFHLDEEEFDELSLAARLHDCGKVTTPEYVVDKATKLETINNRIHEIRTRFEVMRRDAEIEYWKAIAAGGDEASLKKRYTAKVTELKEDFAYVAECNVGGEFLDQEKIDRVRKIAEKTFTRHFDRTIGLSVDEQMRHKDNPPPPAPAEETLLQDRPDHMWAGYNLGEVYNLAIAKGTLTDQERQTINNHVVMTKEMLDKLPFPKNLKRVPEWAANHHEKLDGTGYPSGLKAEDLSTPARIMAIADVFEALTAADRPYKPAKTLSQAIKILWFMKKDNHVDPDLFDLFLTSGAYKTYAEKFLRPEQIDEVDIAQYITQPQAAE